MRSNCPYGELLLSLSNDKENTIKGEFPGSLSKRLQHRADRDNKDWSPHLLLELPKLSQVFSHSFIMETIFISHSE